MCIEIHGNGHHFTHHLNGFLLTALTCKTQQPILKLLLFGSLKKKEKRFQKARIHFHLASIYKWSCSFYKPVKMEGE